MRWPGDLRRLLAGMRRALDGAGGRRLLPGRSLRVMERIYLREIRQLPALSTRAGNLPALAAEEQVVLHSAVLCKL